MDDLKYKAGLAGERLGAIHNAAITAAGNGKTKVQDAFTNTSDLVRRIREAFHELWHHELIIECRERVAAFGRDTVQRLKDGAPPLSPVLLYEELVALFKDRVWRRSVVLFALGACVGGGAGLALGLRVSRAPPGPHARALHTSSDRSVILVEDAVTPGAGPGEVLVRVQAFSVSGVDRSVLRGRGAGLRALLGRSCITVGRGFAGVVLDVGAGVTSLELGDEVWGCVSEWTGGAACELLTIRSTRVSKRPLGLAADAAASLPWAGTEALRALHALGYEPAGCKGKRVAVSHASSGEGCVLIQLLSAGGAHVTAAGPRAACLAVRDLGAQEYIEVDLLEHAAHSWTPLELEARTRGPWDAVIVTGVDAVPTAAYNANALLKASAPRRTILDLRPGSLMSDRLTGPLSLVFAVGFYSYRVLRYVAGAGGHTDWLESPWRLRAGLARLAQLVDSRQLAPVLDKVYLPQDYETALAHACSDDAIGTSVIRFP